MVATLFLRTHIHSQTLTDGSLAAGMLFYSLIQALFSGLAELTFTVNMRCLRLVHQDAMPSKSASLAERVHVCSVAMCRPQMVA